MKPWWNVVKRGEMFGLTRSPTFKWRPWPCARLGRIASTFTAQGKSYTVPVTASTAELHWFSIPFECPMSWGLKGIHPRSTRPCVCTCVRGMKVWILDGCFNAELYSPWMPAWIWFISYVCPATKIKNVMCKSNHRKITSHCHGTRKIILKKITRTLQTLWRSHTNSINITQPIVKRNHLLKLKTCFCTLHVLIFGM